MADRDDIAHISVRIRIGDKWRDLSTRRFHSRIALGEHEGEPNIFDADPAFIGALEEAHKTLRQCGWDYIIAQTEEDGLPVE